MKHMKNFGRRRNQPGLTLIELMIGIGIALILTAVSVTVAVNVRTDQKTSELHTQLVHISSAVAGLAPNGNYTDFGHETLINAGKVPEAWLNPAGDGIVSSFGGAITIDNNGGQSLNITVAQVPSSACSSVLNNVHTTFAQISVGGAAVDTLTPAGIADACASEEGKTDLVFGMCASASADCFGTAGT